jgi:hypothetical protein
LSSAGYIIAGIGTFSEIDAILLPSGDCGKVYVIRMPFTGNLNVQDQKNTEVAGMLQYVAGFVTANSDVRCGPFTQTLSTQFKCGSSDLPVVECGQLQVFLTPEPVRDNDA